MPAGYEPVIGLEVHAQLLTQSKLFCGCPTRFGQAPNSNVCPVCLGLPGALPVINRGAIELALRAALALGCSVHRTSVFARKQYFYPDLPKGYQISQFERPLATDGELWLDLAGARYRAGITRVHLEEDAGKNVHGAGQRSSVDLNRAGVPLIEIVGAPDLRSSEQAAVYLRELRDLLMFAGVIDGNLEEGSFRCDANVSVRPAGQATLGTRTELKNINSFRFVQRAIDEEIARQVAIVSSGGKVVQETRSFDPDSGRTRSLRTKEDSHDYRYFPDPDLPPLCVGEELLSAAQAQLAARPLPRALRERWVAEHGLSEQAARTLSGHPCVAALFEDALRAGAPDARKLANWIQTEVLRETTTHGLGATFPVSARQLAELLTLLERGAINGKQAKEVYAALVGNERSPAEIVAERGMQAVNDEGAILALVDGVLSAHPAQAQQYRAGKKGLLGFFVGKVMKETRGSADPQRVSELLTARLEGES